MFKDKFKKFGGDWIPDIIEYLKEYVNEHPNVTITVGCDSIQKRRRTIYASTIMLYDRDIRNGAHVVFFRQAQNRIRDNFERLYLESKYALDLADYLNAGLEGHYTRKDLSEFAKKHYKYHIGRCEGRYTNIADHLVESYIDKQITLTDAERDFNYKLVDIHLDYNPVEYHTDWYGRLGINRSYQSYKNYAPWLRSLDYRVWVKPNAPASTSAADLLLQKYKK